MFNYFKLNTKTLTGLLSLVILFFVIIFSLNSLSIYSISQHPFNPEAEYFRVRIRSIQGLNQDGQKVARVLILEGLDEGRLTDAFFQESKKFETGQVVIASLNSDQQIILKQVYKLDFLYTILILSLIFFLLITFVRGIFVSLAWLGIFFITYIFYNYFNFTESSWKIWLWLFLSGSILQIAHLKLNLKIFANFFTWLIVSAVIFFSNYLALDFLNISKLNLTATNLVAFNLTVSFVGFYFYLNLSQILTDFFNNNQLKPLIQTFQQTFKPIRDKNLEIISLVVTVLLVLNLSFLNPDQQNFPNWLIFSSTQLYLSLSAMILLVLNLFIVNFLGWLIFYFSNNFNSLFKQKKAGKTEAAENLFTPKPRIENLDLKPDDQLNPLDIQQKLENKNNFKLNLHSLENLEKERDSKNKKQSFNYKKNQKDNNHWLENLQTLEELEKEVEESNQPKSQKKPSFKTQKLEDEDSSVKPSLSPEEELLRQFKISPANKNHPSAKVLEKRNWQKIDQDAKKIRGVKILENNQAKDNQAVNKINTHQKQVDKNKNKPKVDSQNPTKVKTSEGLNSAYTQTLLQKQIATKTTVSNQVEAKQSQKKVENKLENKLETEQKSKQVTKQEVDLVEPIIPQKMDKKPKKVML